MILALPSLYIRQHSYTIIVGFIYLPKGAAQFRDSSMGEFLVLPPWAQAPPSFYLCTGAPPLLLSFKDEESTFLQFLGVTLAVYFTYFL